MQQRPDPAIRRRRITRGRAIAAALSVGSAVALTAAIAVTDDAGAGASSPSTPASSPDRATTNPAFGDQSHADPYGDESQTDPYRDGSNSDTYGFSGPDSGQPAQPHTSSRGS